MLNQKTFFYFIFIIGAAVFYTACSASSDRFVASSDARRYEFAGRVVSVDRRARQVIIAHEAIPEFMDAMTMPFTVKEEWALDVMQPGNQIRAVLIVDGERSWIEQPTVTGEAVESGNVNATTNRALEAQPGANVPDFSLVNQDNRPININQFRGQAVLLTFIYTRCPLPDYCPLISRRFAEVNQLTSNAENNLGARVRMLSVTIDPEHDTPNVLRAYGQASGADAFERWQFATGTPQQIGEISQFFGLNYEWQNNQIVHTLRTIVIAPDGKVFRVYRGSEWTTAQAVNDLNEALSSS